MMVQVCNRKLPNSRMQMTSQSLAKGTNVLQKYDYGYGQFDQNGTRDATKNNGQIATIESFNGGTTSNPTSQYLRKYEYDSLGRLKIESEIRSDTSAQVYKQKFSFDRFGNRYLKSADNPSNQNPLFPTFIEDNNIDRATNRLASNTDTVYDEAGNVVTDGKYRNLKYYYDASGRMVKSSTVTDANVNSAVFDAGGNKVASLINGIWKFKIYDLFGKLISEYGGPATSGTGGVSYVYQDIQGSTRTVTNAHGFIKARMDYQAFGEELPSNIGRRTATGYGQTSNLTQRYALTERDSATGLDDTPWRKYGNRAGRWTSPDRYTGSAYTSNPQSFNRFSYVTNDPVNFIDPSGLLEEAIEACSYSGARGVDGELIYDGHIVNGHCVSDWGEVLIIGWGWAIWSNPSVFSIINPIGPDILPQGGGGRDSQTGIGIGIRTDKFWGMDNGHFQKWYHKCWKSSRFDATRDEMEEAFQAWLAAGSPTNGKCGGGGKPQREYRREFGKEKNGFEEFERRIPNSPPIYVPIRPPAPLPGTAPTTPAMPILIIPQVVICIVTGQCDGDTTPVIS